MLITSDNHWFLPETAFPAATLPCEQKRYADSSRVNVLALVARCLR
jgi:hypothetical protein